MNRDILSLATIAAATALCGCASFTNKQPTRLNEGVGETLSFVSTTIGDVEGSLRAAKLVGRDLNATSTNTERDVLKGMVCDSPMTTVGAAGGTLGSTSKTLDKIAEPPKESFSGLVSAVGRSKKKLEALDRLKAFPERQTEAEVKRKADNELCRRDVDVDLTRTIPEYDETQFKSRHGYQLRAFGIGDMVFIRATADLLLNIGSIYEESVRAEAVKKFAATYRDDVACALHRLDEGADLPWAGPDACKPKAPSLVQRRYDASSAPAQTRFGSAVAIQRTYLLRRALLAYRDSQAGSAATQRRITSSEEAIKFSNQYAALRAIDVNGELLPELRNWFYLVFESIRLGPQTPQDMVDSLLAATDNILGLNEAYQAWEKARGER